MAFPVGDSVRTTFPFMPGLSVALGPSMIRRRSLTVSRKRAQTRVFLDNEPRARCARSGSRGGNGEMVTRTVQQEERSDVPTDRGYETLRVAIAT